MRHRRFAWTLLSIICSLGARLATAQATGGDQQPEAELVPRQPEVDNPAEALTATPILVSVTRARRNPEAEVAPEIMMFASRPPGPHLAIEFLIDLPEALRLAGLESVESASVIDSEGNDLVAAWLRRDPEEPPAEMISNAVTPNPHKPLLRLHVSPPVHEATTVSGTLIARVHVASGLRRVTLEPAHTWTRIDDPALGEMIVEYCGGSVEDMFFDLRPPDAVKFVRRFDPGLELPGLPNGPSMSDSDSVRYLRRRESQEPGQLLVWEGLRTILVEAEFHDLALP